VEHSTTQLAEHKKRRLIFFDGDCNLCQYAVQFVIQRDKKGRFSYASLQSEIANELLSAAGRLPLNVSTFVLWEEGNIFYRSTAALRVAKGLPALWPLLYAFIIVPIFIRDGMYNWIAANRYKWWGKSAICWVPKPEWKNRFPESLQAMRETE
jgi:predicted DCC family thiol-disulfide oxidoreductase YuxK